MSWLGWGSQPALPTALELAVSFGVEDDTEKYKKRFEDRFDVFQSAQLLVNSMKPSPARETVLNEYAALYLPRHIRGCLAAPPWVSQIWWGVLQWLVRYAQFSLSCPLHAGVADFELLSLRSVRFPLFARCVGCPFSPSRCMRCIRSRWD